MSTAAAAKATIPTTEIVELEDVEGVQESAVPLGQGGGTTAIEVDEEAHSGSTSDVESGESTATTSLSSSVFSFTYANGRRYHSDRFKAQYFLPNDEQEQDRLDLFHHIFLSLLGGKLYTAPLHAIELHRVLDVGTGTGIWAIDFADEFPQVEVIGPDLSPIQPNWVPPNCKFEVDDLEGVWTYKDNYFDYIHMRSMSGSFRDWPLVLKQVYRTTVPGGYFEYQDYGSEAFKTDGTKLVGVDDEHPLSTYLHHVITVSEELGTPLVMARKMEELIKEAGFEDVRVQTAVWPVGDWPKDKRLKQIGRFARQGVLDSLYPFGVHILTKKGWTVEEVKELCQKAHKSLTAPPKNSDVGKYYFQGWFVYGRKPKNK